MTECSTHTIGGYDSGWYGRFNKVRESSALCHPPLMVSGMPMSYTGNTGLLLYYHNTLLYSSSRLKE